MPWGLKRYYGTGGLHFITWSCYRRSPLLTRPARDLLLSVLELMRERYRFVVVGYVVMPEHIHLLISEPQVGNTSTVVQAIKLGFSRRWAAKTGLSGQFWQRRFYDFNLWSQRKEVEKLKYADLSPMPLTGPGAVIAVTRAANPSQFASTTGHSSKRWMSAQSVAHFSRKERARNGAPPAYGVHPITVD